MTTGFCGSLTTFSSWQLDVFMSWLNPTHDHRDWFRDVRVCSVRVLYCINVPLGH